MRSNADHDFKELVAKVPDGCLLTIVSDSCHSGGLIDKAKEQIGNSTKQNRSQQTADQQETRPPSGTSLLGTVHGVFESLSNLLHRFGSQQSGGHGQSNGSTELDTKADQVTITAPASVK